MVYGVQSASNNNKNKAAYTQKNASLRKRRGSEKNAQKSDESTEKKIFT